DRDLRLDLEPPVEHDPDQRRALARRSPAHAAVRGAGLELCGTATPHRAHFNGWRRQKYSSATAVRQPSDLRGEPENGSPEGRFQEPGSFGVPRVVMTG